MQENILNYIGNTPLIALRSMHNFACEIWVKLESRNPGGSIKDRIAMHMLSVAFAQKKIQAGGTIIEPTSGNTGIALAMIAAVKKLQCVIVMPESMSIERQKTIKAYGARLILTPAKEGMQGAVDVAKDLLARTENAFMPSQFTNKYAVEAHYLTTGPEILAQMEHKLDALVVGFGTGSCISGTGLFLREHLPHLQIVGVEPAESPLLSAGKSGSHGIQGIGANFIPDILRRDIISEVCTVSTHDAIMTAQKLQSVEGISCGISSGANVYAALQLAAKPHMQGKRIVTFICDGAERYLSTPLFE